MTPKLTLPPLFALAAFALCGTIVLAQQTPAASAPATTAPSAAPIERQGPSGPATQPGMRRGVRPGAVRPGMMPGRRGGQGNFYAGRMPMQNRAGLGGMEGGFNIAPSGMWWKNTAVVQRLTLTPDQVKRMDGIFQESRLQLIDLRANVEKQNAMLEPLLSANPPDTVKAMAQIDKVAEARAELEKANAKMLLGLRGVLTPDQWTKLHEGRGTGGFGARGGPGGAGRGPNAPAMP